MEEYNKRHKRQPNSMTSVMYFLIRVDIIHVYKGKNHSECVKNG